MSQISDQPIAVLKTVRSFRIINESFEVPFQVFVIEGFCGKSSRTLVICGNPKNDWSKELRVFLQIKSLKTLHVVGGSYKYPCTSVAAFKEALEKHYPKLRLTFNWQTIKKQLETSNYLVYTSRGFEPRLFSQILKLFPKSWGKNPKSPWLL